MQKPKKLNAFLQKLMIYLFINSQNTEKILSPQCTHFYQIFIQKTWQNERGNKLGLFLDFIDGKHVSRLS